MTAVALLSPVAHPRPPDTAGRTVSGGQVWPRLGFAVTVGGALLLDCWRLSINGVGNTYYAAASRSMARSWHNFFFLSFDPGGFISVDKPPVFLWVDGLAVRLFGYSSWSLLLPSTLAGAGTVAILWCIVGRRFGPLAAFVAAAALALTPVTVAVDRLNLPDPFMVLLLVVAAWAVLRALDTARWGRWCVAAGAAVGLAFNTKMLAAAIPVPALVAALVVGSAGAVAERLRRAVVFAATAVVTALPWMIVVDLVPPASRPYVGGSTNNSVLDLVVGYNGLGRVDGQGQAGAGLGGGFGNAGGILGGQPGVLRLLSNAVGGQIAWLLLLALAGAVAAWGWTRRRRLGRAAVLLWTGWVVLFGAVFSLAHGTFHSYYTSALAPGLAALVGIGAAAIVALGRRQPAWWAGAAGALLLTAWLQLVLTGRADGFWTWTRPVLAAGGIVATAAGVLAMAAGSRVRRVAVAGTGIALAAALVAPAAWAVSETAHPPLNASLPQAGPRDGAAAETFGSRTFDPDPVLAAFLRRHRDGTTWDLATENAQMAAGLEAQEGLSVMALGGFQGTDPAATPMSVGAAVRAGRLRYFLTGSGPGGPSSGRPRLPFGTGVEAPSAAAVLAVVAAVCAPVTAASTGGELPARYDGALFDCHGDGAEIASSGR